MTLAACSSSDKKPELSQSAPTPTTQASDRNKCGDPVGPEVNLVARVKTTVEEIPVYSEPGGAEPVSTLANPFPYNGDPDAPIPLLFLIKDAPERNACAWMEVYLAQRPNGSTGWIKRSDVEVTYHKFRMEAHLADFQLKVFENGEIIHEFPIAVATDDTPTPGGLYYTNMLLQPPDPDGDYGPYAFGLSGYSEKLTSFNGGDGQLGIHGTNHPEKIGSKVSHGCIRLENANITVLATTLPLGVPVQIFA